MSQWCAVGDVGREIFLYGQGGSPAGESQPACDPEYVGIYGYHWIVPEYAGNYIGGLAPYAGEFLQLVPVVGNLPAEVRYYHSGGIQQMLCFAIGI